MRAVHWLAAIGAALFVSGIAFIIAGARADRLAPAAAPALPAAAPVATVKQIMTAITAPAATFIFDSVVTTVSFKGIDDKAPRTDEEWEAVGASAAALVESGNLMLMGSRVVDTGDWVSMSRALIDAGNAALRATQAKNVEQFLAAGEAINSSCENCHRRYQRGS